MADLQRHSFVERDVDQAITALKKGAHLLKYGRRGKPKFCPFRLSTDESTLIWYYGKDERRLELSHVSRIIPGQRTAVFQRYPRPEKEYQSFSLIHNERSLDLICLSTLLHSQALEIPQICKDKDEAEVWFVGLKALLARGSHRKTKSEARGEAASSDSPNVWRVSRSSSFFAQDLGDTHRLEHTQSRLGKAFAEVLSFTASSKNHQFSESSPNANSGAHSPPSVGAAENLNSRTSGTETLRVSLSSAVSTSSQGSYNEDFDNLGDIFVWGEGTGAGVLGGGVIKIKDSSHNKKVDALVPKALESTAVLDVHSISCGQRHAIIVNKQGEIYSWGEESGGRLGHGVDADVLHPKIIETLNGKAVEMVACGDYHTCAVTNSGDLYTWGMDVSSDLSYWIPKRVSGPIGGLHVSFVSCGPWHTALITSAKLLFTFGDGTFGALGHGDHASTSIPREVETLKGFHTINVACGVWHTAAVVKIITESSENSCTSESSGRIFTWGDGEYGQLGHGDNEQRLVPECLSSLIELDFSHVACGNNLTAALTTSGKVYTMGRDGGKTPSCVNGSIANSCVEEIACGSHHIAVLTSKGEVYTWGRGANGQLGHGDNEDRSSPTLVTFLKEKHVKSVACGSNFTAVICIHKWISSADNSVCSNCHNPFNFMRKRHNCYNCGLGFCVQCTTRKSIRASLAPSMNKPYRVCDDCFVKLQKVPESSSLPRLPYVKSASTVYNKASETMSRLSFTESMKCDRMSSFSLKQEPSNHNRVFPLSNGNVPRASTCSKSPSSPYGSSPGSLSFIVHDSRTFPLSPSPVLGKSPRRPMTPPPSSSLSFRTPQGNHDEAKSSNDSLSMEVKSLRAQVERLTSKSHLLESELERKSEQLKEVTARAAEEAEKSKAAKEVIKSLASQIKEMAERAPQKQAEQIKNDTNGPSNGTTASNRAPQRSESSGTSSTPLSNGAEAQVQKSERTIQDETGVYITFAPLRNGINELKRVRFSRKQFTEEQAEKWWAENGTRVCEQHNIRTT